MEKGTVVHCTEVHSLKQLEWLVLEREIVHHFSQISENLSNH